MSALCPARHDNPRQSADGLVLCWAHRDRLAAHLAELPGLHRACGAALQARGAANGHGRVSGTTDPGLSLSDAAVAAREHIRVELVAWVRIGSEEGPWDSTPADSIASMAHWLWLRVDWYAARPYAGEVARTIADTRSEARRAAYPEPSRRVDIGPCVEPGCEGRLFAIVRAHDSLLPSDIRCDVAGRDPEEPHVWTPDEWQALKRRMAGTGYAELARRIRHDRQEES